MNLGINELRQDKGRVRCSNWFLNCSSASLRRTLVIGVSWLLVLGNLPGITSVQGEEPALGTPRALSRDEVQEGWIALFDGETSLGWKSEGDANFRIVDGLIQADSGSAPCLFRTTSQFDNFELSVDFQGTPQTNSGVFVRTPPSPKDPASDCFEINIASKAVSPFPTGSIVGRKAATLEFDPSEWHRMIIRAQGGTVEVIVDDQPTVMIEESLPTGRGFIGLQFNSGLISFTNVFLRPLGLESHELQVAPNAWRIGPEPESLKAVLTEDQTLRLENGVGFIESSATYADFILQLDAKTGAEGTNSGLFFRCIPGSQLDGYESQIHHGFIDGDRTKPADFGTGGIFRRSPARLVVSDDQKWFTQTLIVEGNHFAVWVDGIQVVDWVDERPADPNPRRGSRRDAGSLALQLHDLNTYVDFRLLRVRELAPRVR